MEPTGSLPCSQEPATSPCSEPDEFRPHLRTYFLKIHSNIVLPGFPSDLLPSVPTTFYEICILFRLLDTAQATQINLPNQTQANQSPKFRFFETI
jgi:hypothetical protein